jgi:hypothetical protein
MDPFGTLVTWWNAENAQTFGKAWLHMMDPGNTMQSEMIWLFIARRAPSRAILSFAGRPPAFWPLDSKLHT